MKQRWRSNFTLQQVGRQSHDQLLTSIGNEYTKNVEIPIPPPPPRNLIVIDVHVSLPSEEPSSSSSSSSQPHVKSDRRGSRLHSNAGASLAKLHGQSSSKLAVHTHQVYSFFI